MTQNTGTGHHAPSKRLDEEMESKEGHAQEEGHDYASLDCVIRN
jgi:hypothetical protein